MTTVTADDVRRWLVSLRGKVAPSTEYRNYSGLRQFFAWCVREDELDVSPLANIKPPKVPEPHTAMLTKEQTKTLLPSCAGKDLISRRDTAIILLLADTGMRRSELANLTTEDLDLRGRPVCVEGKGDASHRKRFRMVRSAPERRRVWTATCGPVASIRVPTSRGCGFRSRDGSPRTA